MARTKIVCTIGPASADPKVLRKMVAAGMTVARLNFSHGTHEQHQGFIDTIRTIELETGTPILILQDLQGPKIRVGELPEAGLNLRQGMTVHFSPRAKAYTDQEQQIPVTYGGFARDVKEGDRVMIDDGNVVCRVSQVHQGIVAARVMVGGLVTSHKGVNLPDSSVRLSALTAKDQTDVAFGVRAGVDAVVLSFVSNADDVRKLRELMKREEKRQGVKAGHIQVIAKLERADAMRRMDEIIEEADGVMVGRGDLGVEIPPEEVPLRQKEMTRKCRCAGVPVIVATQMLESMRDKPKATRAEVSDVANAVMDHADAVMLSAESATGKYPVQAVETLASVATTTEASVYDNLRPDELCVDAADVAVAQSLVAHAQNGMKGLVTSTQYGDVYRALGRHRPEMPLYVAAADAQQARQLQLRWGVVPFVQKRARSVEAFERSARSALVELGYIQEDTPLLFVGADVPAAAVTSAKKRVTKKSPAKPVVKSSVKKPVSKKKVSKKRV